MPQSALWQRVRQRALDAVPPGANVDFKSPLTLAAWQARGTYTVASTTATKFTIAASPTDFGGALISDAAYHLDHALEHQVSLMKTLASPAWNSPAWQAVTFYYWAYFAAMAFSRMLGHALWFVTSDVAKQFTKLAPAGAASMGKGTYEVICGPAMSAGTRSILLVKRQRRIHEQLWTTVFGLFSEIYAEVGAGVASPQEERLFMAIIASAAVLGDDWPSALRNVVNYRPGFAYAAPRFKSSLDTFTYLSTGAQTVDGLVDRLENNTILMRLDPSIERQPKLAARMLIDLTILLSRIAHSLHDEIVDRSGLDRRWLVSKNRFAQQRGLITAGAPWPC
ncbi:hypothetical protein [Variovorax sp. PBL-E5]|uniref:hypothetical protein n=1 Tax=Variovorax sp. PBL-E5 TaxID=434014 RepID=UPI001E5539BC|nr:hypothetical protein [Variovorax sp. PBL-E5]